MSRNDFFVLGSWCAAALALFSPVWARFGTAFFNHGDLYTYHVPLRALTASELQSGRLPFWNPYILLGVPHSANPQTVLFYPGALLSSFFPVVTALVWDQIIHLLWAGIGMFLLARSQRLCRSGAFALASAYALSPFLVYRVTAGIPTLLAALSWTPWLWLAWLSGFPELLAASIALQILSGHGQFLIINMAGMTLWALCREERMDLFKRLAVGGAAAVALTLIQSVLTAQYLARSVRSGWSGAMSGAYALPSGALWTWINPGVMGTPQRGDWANAISVFYETCGGWVGPLILAFSVWGLIQGRRRAPALALAVAGVFLAFGPRGDLSRAILGLPIFAYMRTPSRWLFLTLWAVVLLAGKGLFVLRGRRWSAGVRFGAAIVVFLPLAIWDARFLRPQDPSSFLKPRAEISETLAGRPFRVLTDPDLANPNKSSLYHLMNVNGYEAFYPRGVPSWAAQAEGVPAADASRVFVSKWRSERAVRAGVSARLSPLGVERGSAWPLAVFIDNRGQRILPDPHLWIERPDRWRVRALVPSNATALGLSASAYPGWSARLGGETVVLASWDGIFMAAPLSSRSSEKILDLTLQFSPTGWSWLAALTIAAWVYWGSALARRVEVV